MDFEDSMVFSLIEVEKLLPRSLRDNMLPVEHENAQLLAAVIQSSLSARQLQCLNASLKASMTTRSKTPMTTMLSSPKEQRPATPAMGDALRPLRPLRDPSSDDLHPSMLTLKELREMAGLKRERDRSDRDEDDDDDRADRADDGGEGTFLEEDVTGMEEHLALSVAEVVALLISLRTAKNEKARREAHWAEEQAATVEELRFAYEECLQNTRVKQEQAETFARVLKEPLDTRDEDGDRFCAWRDAKLKALSVRERYEQEVLCWQESLDGTLAHLQQEFLLEEQVLAECCEKLGTVEREAEMGTESREVLRERRWEVEQLETLRKRLEDQRREEVEKSEESQLQYHRETLHFEGQIQRCADLQQELTGKAWSMSNHLQKKLLETEAMHEALEEEAASELAFSKAQSELRELEKEEAEAADARWAYVKAEKALAPKQREVAEALNESLELRRSLAFASRENQAAETSEARALRDFQLSRKRNASLRESLKGEQACLAELRESHKELEAKDRKVLQERKLEARFLQSEERHGELDALRGALRAETSQIKTEAGVRLEQ